jgi:hypothetical protein
MRFLSIWQQLAHKYLGFNYAVYEFALDVTVSRAIVYNSVLYIKRPYAWEAFDKKSVIFSTLDLTGVR